MLSMKRCTQLSGMLKQQNKLMVPILLLCKDKPQLYQITTTELMLGLILNLKSLTKKNGMPRLLNSPRVVTSLLLKDLITQDNTLHRDQLQPYQIIIIELMLGLIHSTKKVMKKSGMPRQQNWPMVHTLLLKEPHEEYQWIVLWVLIHLILQMITIYKTHGLKTKLNRWKKLTSKRKH